MDGSRLERACETMGLSARTVQRWRDPAAAQDRRAGPRERPRNALSPEERALVVETANAPAYRDLSPNQIVPRLADEGIYVASESSFYRILREARMMAHRDRARPPVSRPREHVAYGPGQLWSWDITYLATSVRGSFYRLYMVVDIWSRMIVGWAVHDHESGDLAAELLRDTYARQGVGHDQLVLHSDNGSPMKASTMIATLQRLGVVPSFSRPRVHDDNPYSESLFRTLKYRPEYPNLPFASIEAARAWVARFVRWYNTEHCHSALRFVTPEQRHTGRDKKILEERRRVYEAACQRRPERWTQGTRNWTPAAEVRLNPEVRHAS